MRRTPCASTYTVDILIALAAVFREIYASAEHSTNVCVSFVETLLHDSIDERTAVKQHSLIRLWHCRAGSISEPCIGRSWGRSADFLGHFLPPVSVTFPQLAVLNFLYLRKTNIIWSRRTVNIGQTMEDCNETTSRERKAVAHNFYG